MRDEGKKVREEKGRDEGKKGRKGRGGELRDEKGEEWKSCPVLMHIHEGQEQETSPLCRSVVLCLQIDL